MKINFFRVSLVVFVLLNFSKAFAQSYSETAGLFSRTRPGGSARIQGIGGSQVALGGDYSSALSNPAGLGMFNRSEVSISAGLNSNTSSASYLGNNSSDNRTMFNIPGVSFVYHMPKDNGSFLGGSFAFSLSRTNDFNRSTTYSAYNGNNSIVDYFIDQANGQTTDQFSSNGSNYNTPTGLAYFNYLIGPKSILDPPGPSDQYFTDATYGTQQEDIVVKGASNQYSFAYGGNVQDKFFFGAGIGITSLRYKTQKIFSESFAPDAANPNIQLNYLQLNENLDIHGSGVNATFGAMARPVNFFQIGASFTTPTVYTLTDSYSATMGTKWNNFDYYGDGSTILGDNTNNPVGTDVITSSYNLTTPLKFSAGLAFISKYGFLTGDVELTNPAKTKYSSNTAGVSYTDDNNNIKATYQSVVNYRVGAEFRYNIFRVRAGYNVMANTYRADVGANNQITSITGGVGIRTKKNFYIDLALVNSSTKNYYYAPYTFSDGTGPVVSLKNRITTGIITAGFTF